MRKKQFAFGRRNYKFMFIGIAIIAVGFLLMSGGGSDDPNIFTIKNLIDFVEASNGITKGQLVIETFRGNYYAKKNAVMFDLQNGKQNVVCFCDNIYTAQGIVEGLNALDKLEADGIELKK